MKPSLKQYYLFQLGVQSWSMRETREQVAENKTQLLKNNAMNIDNVECQWAALQQAVVNCTACGLDKTRSQTVFGVGNRQAKLLIVGEAPGFYEDQAGEPFVGKAGQLLNSMLKAIGLDREMVYIANVLKCRPPNNRDPQPDEIKHCSPFLERQIALIQPKAILAVGRFAAHSLLKTNTGLNSLRAREHVYSDSKIALFVTFHPAYLLRNPADKAKAWEDLVQLKKKLV